jgi:protoporphyrinogen oxidase
MAKERIAVLGAGPMGLAVAYQLVLDGYQPVIFEADERVGGMTACFDFSGLQIERYYHFHCTSDTGFLNLLDELGIADRMNWTETKMGYWFNNQLQPWGNPIALLRFSGLTFIGKIRYGLMAFFATKRKNWKSLDEVEATDWIKKWVGEAVYEIMWHKLFEYKFHHFTGNLSAAWIWSRIRRLGQSRYNLFKEKLGYLDGGSQTLLNRLQEFLEANGAELNLGQPVTRVLIDASRVTGVETKTGRHGFSKVISTIPLPYVPQVFPDLPDNILNKYRSVNNIAVVCVIAKLSKPLSENFWVNTNDDEMDIPGLVEYSNLRPLKNAVVYVPFYLPGEHPKYSEPDEIFIEKVKTYLMKINPDLSEDDFLDVRASRYRFAQPICEPGFLGKLPSVKLPVQGLCVADTSYYYPEDRGISESIDFGREMARTATC